MKFLLNVFLSVTRQIARLKTHCVKTTNFISDDISVARHSFTSAVKTDFLSKCIVDRKRETSTKKRKKCEGEKSEVFLFYRFSLELFFSHSPEHHTSHTFSISVRTTFLMKFRQKKTRRKTFSMRQWKVSSCWWRRKHNIYCVQCEWEQLSRDGMRAHRKSQFKRTKFTHVERLIHKCFTVDCIFLSFYFPCLIIWSITYIVYESLCQPPCIYNTIMPTNGWQFSVNLAQTKQ